MQVINFSEERCVMCGEIIPEGRQVCPDCEYKVMRGENPGNGYEYILTPHGSSTAWWIRLCKVLGKHKEKLY